MALLGLCHIPAGDLPMGCLRHQSRKYVCSGLPHVLTKPLSPPRKISARVRDSCRPPPLLEYAQVGRRRLLGQKGLAKEVSLGTKSMARLDNKETSHGAAERVITLRSVSS